MQVKVPVPKPYPSISHVTLGSNRSWVDNYQWYIEEKIDGSQLSFFVDANNVIHFYNKSSHVSLSNSTFEKSTTMLRQKKLVDNFNKSYVYHGESVCKQKHNVVVYDRTPKYYFILYDIYDFVADRYLSLDEKIAESKRVGLEYVQIFYHNADPAVSPYEKCKEIMNSITNHTIQSCLGGIPEGMVLKHHAFVSDNKTVATKLKYVSKEFKERHKTKQPKIIYNIDELVRQLGLSCNTSARFQKAYQHLKESSMIDENPTPDLIPLFESELDKDFDKEYADEIILELCLILHPIVLRWSRIGMQQWFYKKIGLDTPAEDTATTSASTTTPATGQIHQIAIDLGLSYLSENTFDKVYELLLTDLKTEPSTKHYGRFIGLYDTYFDQYKSDIKSNLWTTIGPIIKQCARTDLKTWFDQKFDGPTQTI